MNLEAFYEHIEDVLEQAILNEDGAIGLANLRTAKHWGVNARGTLPLGTLLPGARLEGGQLEELQLPGPFHRRTPHSYPF